MDTELYSKRIENWTDSVCLQSINVGSGRDEAIFEQSDCMIKPGVTVTDNGA